MSANDQITKLVTAIQEIPNKVSINVNQAVAASTVELQKQLFGLEKKLNDMELLLSKMEAKAKPSKKTEATAAPAVPATEGGNVPQAQVPTKAATNNILAYFKHEYENNEEFRAKYHCVDFAATIEKSEEYLKKTTAETKRKHMCSAMYGYISKGTTDANKQLYNALRAQFEAYKKSANAVPAAQTLTTDPPSPTN